MFVPKSICLLLSKISVQGWIKAAAHNGDHSVVLCQTSTDNIYCKNGSHFYTRYYKNCAPNEQLSTQPQCLQDSYLCVLPGHVENLLHIYQKKKKKVYAENYYSSQCPSTTRSSLSPLSEGSIPRANTEHI